MNRISKLFTVFLCLIAFKAMASDSSSLAFSKIYRAVDKNDFSFPFNATSKQLKNSKFKIFEPILSSLNKLRFNRDQTINICQNIIDTESSEHDFLLTSFKRKSSEFCISYWGSLYSKSKSKKLSSSETSFLTNNSKLFFTLNENQYSEVLANNESFYKTLTTHLISRPELNYLIKKIPIGHFSERDIALYQTHQNSKDIILYKNSFSRQVRRSLYQTITAKEIDSDYFQNLVKFIDQNVVTNDFIEDIDIDNIPRYMNTDGRAESAFQMLTQLTISKNKELRSDALLSMLWTTLQIKKPLFYQKILAMIKQEDYSDNPALSFWIGSLYQRLGLISNSKLIFESTARRFPLSFYGILSLKFLSNPDFELAPQRQLASYSQPSPIVQNLLTRMKGWKDLDQIYFKEIEVNSLFAQLKSLDKDSEYFRTNLKFVVSFLEKEEEYLSIFKLYYDLNASLGVEIGQSDLASLFPILHKDKIVNFSRILPAQFVLSIMRQESAFNPKSTSSAGALGLLQLLPQTAKEHVKFRRNKELYNPDLNIKAGIRFLERLTRKYDGDFIKILSAYNAGEGNVKRWLDTYFVSEDPLLTVEFIPFEETRNYVKLIFRNYFYYNYLENNQDFVTSSLADNLKVAQTP